LSNVSSTFCSKSRLGPCLSALSCVSQAKGGEQVKKGYVGIHSSGFKDFLLKPELLRVRFSSMLLLPRR